MNIDTLYENFHKRKETQDLISEVMKLLTEQPRGTEKRQRLKAPAEAEEACGESLNWRLPNMLPTEITVGQQPGSKDREIFVQWMSQLSDPAVVATDASAVKQKLQAITTFLAPEGMPSRMEKAPLAEKLSYLMFLDQFVWMLQEFNASVAGFLWEPFLAALFGGDSRQVATSEGSIADIVIDMGDGVMQPVSLKILSQGGSTKGSFTDLVKHFATGGSSMRYVIILKEKGEGEVAKVDFYEFNITMDTFFEWIGGTAYSEVAELEEHTFTLSQVGKSEFLKLGAGGNPPAGKAPSGQGDWIWLRSAGYARGAVRPEWARVGKMGRDGVAQLATSKLASGKSPYKELNLKRKDKSKKLTDPMDADTELVATVAVYKEGEIQRNYQQMPGMGGSDTDRLWGSLEGLAAWSDLAAQLKGDPQRFFEIVWKGGDQSPTGKPAPGISTPEQFHIGNSWMRGAAEEIGALEVSVEATKKVFEEAGKTIEKDIKVMFCNLAELTDNIGRFFLSQCGQSECIEEDVKNRLAAGANAINNAEGLQAAVESSISRMKE